MRRRVESTRGVRVHGTRLNRRMVAVPVAAMMLGIASPAWAQTFQLPFPCGEVWNGATRQDHPTGSGTHYALDFNQGSGYDDFGKPVVASAAGYLTHVGGTYNSVRIAHENGWETRYLHMNTVTVGNGPVAQGQQIGTVGDTGSPGASHLHYEQRKDGSLMPIYFNGEPAPYSYTYNGPAFTSHNCPVVAHAPRGWLDAAGCDVVAGWAQDLDEPDTPISVHLYFGGPTGSGAPSVATPANIHRDDLCSALGSCAHGFAYKSPLSLFDGQPHPVYAYGISVGGGDNAMLNASPKNLQCPLPALDGVRRHVIDPASFAAWRFDLFRQAPPAGDAAITQLPIGPDLPPAPSLVQVEGEPAVWVVDGSFRRRVQNPESMTSWGFDWGAIVKEPASYVDALTEGPVWRARPILLHESNGTVWLVDDALGGEGGAAGAVGSGGDANAGAGGDGLGGAAGDAFGGAGGAPFGGAAGEAFGGAGSDANAGGTGRGGATWDPKGRATGDPDAEGGCSLGARSGSGPASWGAVLALLGLVVGRRSRARARGAD